MTLYKLGSLLLDISIGLLVLVAIIRLTLALTCFRQNGSRTLTDVQRKTLRNSIIPIAVAGLLSGIASLILLLIC